MAIPIARSIDIVVAVVAVAFFLARQFDLVGPVARWTGLAVFVLYLGWFLRRRSPYRSKPGDLHLNG
jgi:hypothetical protein